MGWPLTQLPGANPTPAPVSSGNPLLDFAKSITDDLGNAANAVTNNVVNPVGKFVGNLPISPITYLSNKAGIGPKSPTVSEGYSSLMGDQGLMGEGNILKGKATPEQLGSLALFAGTLGMDGGAAPEDVAPEEEAATTEAPIPEPQQDLSFGQPATRANYVPPSKFNPPEAVPETPPTMSAPAGGIPPETTQLKGENAASLEPIPVTPPKTLGPEETQTVIPPGGEKMPPNITVEESQPTTDAVEPKPNYDRTYPVSDKVSNSEKLTNQQRGIASDNPANDDQVNATLNGYGIKGTKEQQLRQVNSKIPDLGNQAITTIETEGGQQSSKTLLDLTTNKLKNTSVSNGLNTATDLQLRGVANDYLVDVYNRTNSQMAYESGQPAPSPVSSLPENIPDTTVFKMKQTMNGDSSSTFGKDPTTWSNGQKISRYSRNVFDNVIDDAHPNAAKINNDMNDLYNAKDYLSSGYQKEVATNQSIAGLNPVQRLVKGIESHPIGTIATTLGLTQLPNIIKGVGDVGAFVGSEAPKLFNAAENAIGYEPKQAKGHESADNVHEYSIGTSSSKYQVPALPSGVLAGNDYSQKSADLKKQYDNYVSMNDSYDAGQIKSQMDSLDQTQGNDTIQKMRTTQTLLSNVSKAVPKAMGIIEKADPNYFNLNGALNNFLKSTDKSYSQFGQYLVQLEQMTGADFSKATTKEALEAAIDTAYDGQMNQWNSLVSTYYGQGNGGTNNNVPPANPASLDTTSSDENTLPNNPPTFHFGGEGGATFQ